MGVLVSVLYFLASVAAPTSEVTLTLQAAPGTVVQQSPVPVTVRATPIGGRELKRASPVEIRVPFPGTAKVPLLPQLLWRFEVTSDAWWATTTLYVADPSARLSLSVWPTATLAGIVKPPERETPPSSISVRFTAPPRIDRAATHASTVKLEVEPRGEFECPVRDGRFTCRLPGTVLDLKLRCRGFTSVFRWGENLVPGTQRNLGEIALVPGASIVGTVTTASGPADPASCQVTLNPVAARRPGSAEETARWAGQVQKTKIDQRGFFAFEGLGAGDFTVVATQPGFAPASTGRFSVMERAEAEIRQELLLERPVRLRVTVNPPLDSARRPWRLGILRAGMLPNSREPAFEGTVGEDGVIETDPLAPGAVQLDLFDDAGSRVVMREVEITPETTNLTLNVEQVEVSGHVFLGRTPLSAELWFGRRTGGVKVHMQSGLDGMFVGVVPRQGAWDVQVLCDDPRVDRTLRGVEVKTDPDTRRAEVDLRLPDSTLSGRTVDERGNGVTGAGVVRFDPKRTGIASVTTGKDGSFEWRGLEAGTYTLHAEDISSDGQRESQSVDVEVPTSGPAPPTTLILSVKSEVEGVILGNGLPVVGARVMASPEQYDSGSFMQDTTTDTAGRFTLHFKDSVGSILCYVLPPGFAFTATRVVLGPTRTATINVPSVGGEIELRFSSSIDWVRNDSPKWTLWQDGIIVDPQVIGLWNQLAGGATTIRDATPTLVRMAPGDYRVCVHSSQGSQMRAVTGGGSPDDKCASSYLAPGGRIRMDLRTAR